MPDPVDHLQTVGEIVQGLRGLGLEPVLVGGMALVVLGSKSDEELDSVRTQHPHAGESKVRTDVVRVIRTE